MLEPATDIEGRLTPVSAREPMDCHKHAQEQGLEPGINKKKIFVFCDGTGNEFVIDQNTKSGNSNVVKLYTALRVADDQVAYYHPGVGTMGDPTIRHWLPRFWSKVKGLAFGAGFQANVLDAYRYLMEVYNDGDDIYIFGFSRGSYTARALAGMLHGYGLLCRGNEGHLLYAWNMFYRALEHKRDVLNLPFAMREEPAHAIERNYAFAETFSREVIVRFMGVWDTVSSVGWIYTPLRLLDMAQNPIIQVGRHAVSIDERRAMYSDNLWGEPVAITAQEWPASLKAQGIQQDLAQVWFPGVHSDVGGSYPQSEAYPANQALHWMIEELKLHGAQLCEERIEMVLGKASGVYAADKIYTPAPKFGERLHRSLKGIWWLLEVLPQQYYDKVDKRIQWRVPYDTWRRLPINSFIHVSAVLRLQDKVASKVPYRPSNLTYQELTPLPALPGTTANLEGCMVFNPSLERQNEPDSDAWRKIKVAFGWINFALFWLLVLTLLVLAVAIGLLAIALVVAAVALVMLAVDRAFYYLAGLAWIGPVLRCIGRGLRWSGRELHDAVDGVVQAAWRAVQWYRGKLGP